jgi:hypothetical protein
MHRTWRRCACQGHVAAPGDEAASRRRLDRAADFDVELIVASQVPTVTWLPRSAED